LKTDAGTLTVADGNLANWTVGSHYYSGKVYITSLVANANNGENATYSVTLTGTGALAKAGSSSSGSSSNTGGTSNSGSTTTYGLASYNNNVTINGTSYDVSGGSVTISQPLTSMSVTGSNMTCVSFHYGTNEEEELTYNSSNTTATWTGNLNYSTIEVYHENGDNENPEQKRWFTIYNTSSSTPVDTTLNAPTITGVTPFTENTTVTMSADSGA